MSVEGPAPTPPDPILRADQLLDSISRGEHPPAEHPDDAVVALLADWHAELVKRSKEFEATPEGPATGGATEPAAAPRAAQPAAGTVPRRPTAPRRAWRGRIPRRLSPASAQRPRGRRSAYVGATMALVTVVGGVWFGAARAEPGSVFWPVTKLVYAERAESLGTQYEIGRVLEQARQDLVDGRRSDSRRHLERAESLLATLGQDATTVRLRGEAEELRQLLTTPTPVDLSPSAGDIVAGMTPVPSMPVPALSTSPGSPVTAPTPTPTSAGPGSTTPATTTHPTGPPAGVPPARSANPKRHPSPSTPPPARGGGQSHRDESVPTRDRATGRDDKTPAGPRQRASGRP